MAACAGPVGAGLFLVNLLVILLGAVSLHGSYRQYHDRTVVTAQNLATLLSTEIQGELDRIDLGLQTVAEEAERQAAAGGIDRDAINAFLDRQHRRHPQLHGFRVTDATGTVIYSADQQSVNISDRDYFTLSRSQPVQIHVDGPIIGRYTGSKVMMFSRAWRAPDGSFAGTVYVALPVNHFITLFSHLVLSNNSAVSLRTASDLAVAARFPVMSDEALRQRGGVVSNELQEAVATAPGGGTYEAQTPIDNIRRILSYRQISGYPLYIVVGLSSDDFLESWYHEVWRIGALVGLFVAVTLVGAWFLFLGWQARIEAHDRLRASNADLERFTEILAHHLQEPARLQYSFTQRLKTLLPQPVPPDLAETVDVVLRGALRLRNLIRDARMYLSLNQGNEPSHCAPAAALEQVLRRLQGKIATTGATVRHDEFPPGVAISQDRLEAIFFALLDNALEYHRDGVAPEVSVTTERQHGKALFAVKDNGIGIPPAYQDRVFKVFERLNGNDHLGTGIGLAIARKIVETAHGGIWIESAEKIGTRVLFTLPLDE